MGRRQSYTDSELLDITKRLVLEHGYDGFHLKLLSKHLPGARSTIYRYYSSKEEIVAACMKLVMMTVVDKSSAIDETDPMQALQELLYIYAEESKLHQLLGDAHKINPTSSMAAQDLNYVDQAHSTLKDQLARLFQRALQEKRLREDIPLPVLIGGFFNLVNAPNMMNLPTSEWSKLLFRLWMGGAQRSCN